MTANPQVASTPTSYETPAQKRQREALLIVLHGDGYVQAFSEKHIDVRIAVCPYMESPEGEILAEEFLELSLPWRYRELYWPGNLRAMGIACEARPSEIAYADWQLEMIQTLDRVANDGGERRVWTL
jgi:hypothetical protein